MSWDEIRQTPEPLLRRRLVALERVRARRRAEDLEDQAYANEINWGQEVVGTIPGPKAPYTIKDTPFQKHLRRLQRLGAGLPLEELPEERARRLLAENKQLDAMLMN